MQFQMEALLRDRGFSRKAISLELGLQHKAFGLAKPASKIRFHQKFVPLLANEVVIPKYVFRKRLQ